jgi:protein SCO1/2
VALQPSESNFAVVGFSIDPRERPADAAAALAALADREGGASTTRPIHALTGEVGEIHAVTDALGYRYAFDPALGQYAHMAAITVLTPEGRVVRWLSGLAPDPQELGKAIADAREERVASLGATLLLLCYHYDPVTGRYTLLVSRIIQISGVATVLALASFVGVSVLRESRRGGGAR